MQDTAQLPIAIPAPIVIPSAPIPPPPPLALKNGPLASEYVSDISLEPPNKKRKKDRACDYCRRRKIKCDGPWVHGHVCTNCIHGHRTCTYVESSRPRGPSKAYVAALEDRMERLEGVINQLCPDTDFSDELGPPVIRGSWRDDYTQTSYHLPPSSSRPFGNRPTTPLVSLSTIPKSNMSPVTGASLPTPSVNRTSHLIFKPPRNASCQSTHILGSSSSGSSSDDSSSDSSEETLETWAGGRQKLTLSALESADQARGNSIRFHGRSSTASLVEVTRKFKHLCMQERSQSDARHQEEFIETGEVGGLPRPDDMNLTKSLNTPDNDKVRATRRARFWSTPKWELAWEGHSAEVPHVIQSVLGYFPSSSVAGRLIDLFFQHTNTYLPLLHRPTFDRLWQQGLHHRNLWFSTVCILMFALASRWYESDEDGDDHSPVRRIDWKGIGWRWFFVVLDVHRIQRSLFCPATLFEVQTFTLMALFLRGTTCGPIGWLFTSIGIRKAQDRGAHRRKVYKSGSNADDELWKRAFWVLLTLDRITGASLGRGATVGEEDYDLDLPLEVDDEYWEMGNPEADFKQPPGIPSRMAYFIQFIKLAKIIGFTAKTLYPIEKSKVFSGLIKGDWTQEAILQLKLAMEEWVDNVPDHLRWSEDIEDPIFASQSATIYSLYHCVQMTIWRQFCVFNPSATMPGKSRNESLSAMGICAMSVRASARILDVQMRTGVSNIPNMVNVALVCAGTVAMILWELRRKLASNGKKSAQIRAVEIEGTGIYVHELLDDTDTCIKMLESTKSRWEWAETVLENLKDALPSDDDENFDGLDIAERFQPVNGMSDIVNLPVNFGDDGNAANPHIFQDGTVSFLEHRLRQVDSLPTTTLRSSSEDCRNGISSAQTSNLIPTTLDVHARDRLSQTLDARHCENPTKDTKIPKGCLQWCGPNSQIQVVQNTQRPRSHLFPIQTFASTGRRQPIAEQAPNITRAPPIYQSPFGGAVPPQSGLESIPPRPFQPPVSNISLYGEPPQAQVLQESGPYSELPAMLEWPASSDRERITLHGRHARARAVSLVPAECKRAVPFISNSLRRTSFPNLQMRREGGRTVQRESDTTALRHQDELQRTFPISREADRGAAPEATSNFQVNGSRLTRGEPKVMGWSGDATDTVLDHSGDTESKLIRSTEFRHWNKYPQPPSKRLSTDLGPTQNTQHRFVHEYPYSG